MTGLITVGELEWNQSQIKWAGAGGTMIAPIPVEVSAAAKLVKVRGRRDVERVIPKGTTLYHFEASGVGYVSLSESPAAEQDDRDTWVITINPNT